MLDASAASVSTAACRSAPSAAAKLDLDCPSSADTAAQPSSDSRRRPSSAAFSNVAACLAADTKARSLAPSCSSKLSFAPVRCICSCIEFCRPLERSNSQESAAALVSDSTSMLRRPSISALADPITATNDCCLSSCCQCASSVPCTRPCKSLITASCFCCHSRSMASFSALAAASRLCNWTTSSDFCRTTTLKTFLVLADQWMKARRISRVARLLAMATCNQPNRCRRATLWTHAP